MEISGDNRNTQEDVHTPFWSPRVFFKLVLVNTKRANIKRAWHPSFWRRHPKKATLPLRVQARFLLLSETLERDLTGSPLLSQITPSTNGDER